MSLVQITELLPGASNPASNANSTIASWNSSTGNINGANIRDEGIERRNIKYAAITPPTYRHRYNTEYPTAWTTSTDHGKIPIILGYGDVGTTGLGPDPSIGIGPISYDSSSGDMVFLRFSGEVQVNSAAQKDHIRTRMSLCYRFGLARDGWTEILETARSFKLANHTLTPTSYYWYKGSVTIAHKVRLSGNSASLYFGVLLWVVPPAGSTSSGGRRARIRNCSYSVHTFRK